MSPLLSLYIRVDRNGSNDLEYVIALGNPENFHTHDFVPALRPSLSQLSSTVLCKCVAILLNNYKMTRE